MSGRGRRKKPMYGEMKCDVPGMKSPTLPWAVSLATEGPTTHLLGVPRPAEPAVLEPDRLASLETEASNPDAKDQRSRGDRDSLLALDPPELLSRVYEIPRGSRSPR